MAAQLACGEQAVAVTAVSASLALGEREQAAELAAFIGIRHLVIETREFADSNYLNNPVNRCYFCKTELYSRLVEVAPSLGCEPVSLLIQVRPLGLPLLLKLRHLTAL